ncbi:MAG: cold shock domain-containing protein [Octadecabacter sp.]|nr:cold shock domain-containing protein [Octadecabacter sp.]
MNDIINNSNLMMGYVMWFNAGKGFGFPLPDGGDANILLHASV